VISVRAKRVLVYTIALLTAPVPVMPYEKGTREFALALIICGAVLTFSGFYVVTGEWGEKHRPLFASRLLAASLITLIFGLALILGALLYLFRS
jgi:hypothetical protein